MDSAQAALKHIHGKRLVHQDVKPENIVYSREKGLTVLIDFGFVEKMSDSKSIKKYNHTPMYQHPEWMSIPVDPRRIDTYGLAITFFEVYTKPICTSNNFPEWIQDLVLFPQKYDVMEQGARVVFDTLTERDKQMQQAIDYMV